MGTVTMIQNNKPKTITDWRTYISEPWQKAVESIIETGQRLIEAREKIEHGEWEKIFEGNKPFSVTTAKMLILIAEHPILSNRNHGNVLPPSWRTLYELSKIPQRPLLRLLQEGKIHPEITRKDVEELKQSKEKIEAMRQVIIHSCNEAISMAPCDCGILEGEITEEVLAKIQTVIDTWTRVKDYLQSLGVREKNHV